MSELDYLGGKKNRSQAIREMDKLRLSMFLNDIKHNPHKYPEDQMAWLDWLNEDSGDNVLSL